MPLNISDDGVANGSGKTQQETTSGLHCPVCASSSVKLIPRRDCQDVIFTIRLQRACDECGACFVPPAPFGVRVGVVVLMVLFASGGLYQWVLPSLVLFIRGFFSVPSLLDFSLGVVGISMSFWAVFVTLQSGHYQIISRGNEAS